MNLPKILGAEAAGTSGVPPTASLVTASGHRSRFHARRVHGCRRSMVNARRNANMTRPEHVFQEVTGVKSDDIPGSDIATDQGSIFTYEVDACATSNVV